MRKTWTFLALLWASGCSEFEIVPDTWAPGDPAPDGGVDPGAVDVLLVLDNSCSMMDDWGAISYGLTRVPSDAEAAGYTDWRIVAVSADPSDDLLVGLTPVLAGDAGWAMMGILGEIHEEGLQAEAGMAASLVHQGALRGIEATIVAFVSDEADQSGASGEAMEGEVWRGAWEGPLPYVVAIVGDGIRCGDLGEGYLDVADRVVDVCTTAPWSLF